MKVRLPTLPVHLNRSRDRPDSGWVTGRLTSQVTYGSDQWPFFGYDKPIGLEDRPSKLQGWWISGPEEPLSGRNPSLSGRRGP